jgi:hypothetical protein
MHQVSTLLLLVVLCLSGRTQHVVVVDAQFILPLPGGTFSPTPPPQDAATTNAPTLAPVVTVPVPEETTSAPSLAPVVTVPVPEATSAPSLAPVVVAVPEATSAPSLAPIVVQVPEETTSAPSLAPAAVVEVPATTAPSAAPVTVAVPNDATTATPSAAPVVAGGGGGGGPGGGPFPICNVCGNDDDLVVGDPDALTLDNTIRCGELEELGLAGDLEPEQCSRVAERIAEDCSCVAAAPFGTAATGQVVVTLFSVTALMTPEITSDFEAAMIAFYTENSPDTDNITYRNWTARILTQNMVVLNATTRHRHYGLRLRHLQQEDNATTSLFPLLTRTVMTADVSAEAFETPIDQLLRDTMESNTTGFTSLLSASNEYFATVVAADTSDTTTTTTPQPPLDNGSPTPAPTTLVTAAPDPAPITDSGGSGGGGLSPGAIAGIVVAILFVVVIAIVIIKKSQEGANGGGGGGAAAGAAAGASRAVDEEQPRASASASAIKASTTGSTTASSSLRASSSSKKPPKPKPPTHTVTREIVAPPGKLGLVLDTLEGRGPVVHRVHIDSPMEGKIFKQDVIVAVAGVDTRSMNATHVTKLMHETMEQERVLRIEREEPISETELAAEMAAAMGASVAAAAAATSSSSSIMPAATILVEITAPAGKLGIILDTVEGKGPIVHRVHSESPLKGKVLEGDVICSINGVDTRPMNATHITNIMMETADAERLLVLERVDKKK